MMNLKYKYTYVLHYANPLVMEVIRFEKENANMLVCRYDVQTGMCNHMVVPAPIVSNFIVDLLWHNTDNPSLDLLTIQWKPSIAVMGPPYEVVQAICKGSNPLEIETISHRFNDYDAAVLAQSELEDSVIIEL